VDHDLVCRGRQVIPRLRIEICRRQDRLAGRLERLDVAPQALQGAQTPSTEPIQVQVQGLDAVVPTCRLDGLVEAPNQALGPVPTQESEKRSLVRSTVKLLYQATCWLDNQSRAVGNLRPIAGQEPRQQDDDQEDKQQIDDQSSRQIESPSSVRSIAAVPPSAHVRIGLPLYARTSAWLPMGTYTAAPGRCESSKINTQGGVRGLEDRPSFFSIEATLPDLAPHPLE